MKLQTIAGLVMLSLLGLGLVTPDRPASAQSMVDYQSTPPFVSDIVPPNILLLLDNSGSMAGRACDPTWCGVHSDGSLTPVTQSFVSTSTYSGYFDPKGCYTYDATNTRFDLAANRVSIGATCVNTQWDGNFLNWATFRRFDALKKSMSGGDCVVTRAADGSCPQTAGKITIKAQDIFNNSAGDFTTNAVPSGGANGYVGRIPSAATPGTPANIWIHLRGSNVGAQGTFCVDNDSTDPGGSATCGDGDSFAESQYRLRVTFASEPTGVVQQIGSKARFGLLEFKSSSEGARVLVGLGSRQSIDWSGASVETFNTNMAAVLDGIGESFPSTWTPLSESLYESARYIAQINSTMPGNTSYIYPIAFSGGNSNAVSFAANGIGSIGASEISVLTGAETCPAGYIANACGRDPYFYGSNHTPAWASTSSQVPCCKTFVIIVTDGEPTNDTNVPTSLQDYAHARHGQHCIGGSTTIHAPNGTCNTNSATPPMTLLGEHKTDYASSGNHYLDDVAYWMHINDLRPDSGGATPCSGGTPNIAVINTPGHCLPGFQNATVYTFFAFGNIAGRELLMHTAQLGGFDDSNGNNAPDLAIEWDKVNNANGTSGSTVPGCNADCIPDTYFESSNVDDLQDRLLAALTAILRKSASGSSVSVLASSVTGDGALYQAYFYVSDVGTGGNDVRWLGFTEGLFIDRYGNLREDSVQDGRLVLKDDMIITTRYDDQQSSPTYGKVLVDKYADADGDGVADSTTPTQANQELKDIKPIWEAGKKLALMPSSSRNVLTWVDLNNNHVVDAGEQMAFSTTNSAILKPYLRATASAPYTENNIINFIRGDEIPGMRTRMMDVQTTSGVTPMVWKYGDPIHSPPTLVGVPQANFDLIYGDATYSNFYAQYRNRRQVIYVGANDGMLHAFNAGYYHSGDDPTTTSQSENGWFTKNPTDNTSGKDLGEELFAYVPYELLPQLRFLTQADYSHVYFVDLKPKVVDVRIFTPDADHPDGWGTILIGGFRMGGSCGQCVAGTGAPPMVVDIGGTNRTFYSAYFVLDVTNPEVDPKLLMSFSDAGLGLTTSAPSIVRVSPSADVSTDPTNAKWYMIMGSGPNGYKVDMSTGNQTPSLYVVDLKAGPGVNNSLVTAMPWGSWKSMLSDLVSMDRNLDYRVDMAYFGRAAFDGALPWRGKLYRLSVGACTSAPCSPNTWGVPFGSGRAPSEMLDTFLDKASVLRETGPIVAAPVITFDDANDTWVFFGTGRYFNSSDKVSTDQQYLFGIKDSVAKGTCTEVSQTSCMDNDLVDVSDAVLCTTCASGGTNQISGVSGATDLQSMIGLVQSKRGWFAKLKTVGERAIVPPTLIGGTVFFPTFVPTNDICASTGSSRLYAMYYKTGTSYKDPILGTTTSGGNTTSNTSISLGTGLASSVVIQIISDPKGPGSCPNPPCTPTNAMLFIHTDSGATTNQGAHLIGKPWSRYLTWLHQRD
ncbi:MAG: PilC/PilY family type IV pilus protein [Nitrospiraceae bacterium]